METHSDCTRNVHRDASSNPLLTRTHGRPGEAAVPDETVFGILSRHHVLTGHTSAGQTMTAIMGRRTISPSTSFPSGLSTMLAYLDLPVSSVEDLIDRHTVLPYFQLFVSAARYHAASQLIAKDGAAATKISLGILASRLGTQERLHYCPVCAKEDCDVIGTPTWYRVHQLPGVHVCPYHGVPLQESERLGDGRQRFQLFLPDTHDHQAHATVKIESPEEFSRLLLIARLSAQTLLASALVRTHQSLRTQYAAHLLDLGLATSRCRIRQPELHKQFLQYWAPLHSIEPFKRLFDFHKENTTWLATLCRKQRCTHHPLKHLLLIGFLVDDLPSLSHPMAPVSSSVMHHPTNAIDGPLTSLVLQQGMSLRKAAGVLHVSTNTALVHAQCLQLPVTRRPKKMTPNIYTQIREALASGANAKEVASTFALSMSTIHRVLGGDSALRHRRAQQVCAAHQTAARTNVLNLLGSSPGLGMKALRAMLPADVMWLYRHDHQWLRQLVGPVQVQKKPTMRVDWAARDAMMYQRIRCAAAELTSLPGKPVRVSLKELGRHTGDGSWLEKKLDLLPRTRALLPTILESVEAFQQRRYRWWQERLTGATMYGDAADYQIRRAAGLPKSFTSDQRSEK